MTEKTSGEQSGQAPPEEKNTKAPSGGTSAPAAVWKFFSSVHLAVILLLLLAGVSIIGTVLAQGDSREDNIQLFQNLIVKVFDTVGVVDADNTAEVEAQRGRIRQAAERLYVFSERAGFMNLYHAWYFYLLLGLFAANLTVCSVKRWPITWRLVARNPVRLEEKRFRTMSNRRTVELALPAAEAREKVLAALKSAGFSRKVVESEAGIHFFGQKGVVSRLGVYATHLSILIIMVGGIIGVTLGFKGAMNIEEGTSSNRFYNRRTKGMMTLPFQVRCDNFKVDYYPNSRRPKDYYSDLVVIDGGVETISKRIEVNSPLVWQDIWFYQSSYGETGRGMKATLTVVDNASGETVEKQFDERTREVSAFGVTVKLLQAIPDFTLDENQRPVSRSNQPNNPAALVEVTAGDGEPQRSWLFQARPDFIMIKDLPVNINLTDFGGIQYTGLQVVYDPGVWVIWLGCTVMVLGLYMAFFVSHRRVWALVAAGGDGTTVMLAGSSNKNREAFGEEFQRLGGLIAGGGEAEQKE